MGYIKLTEPGSSAVITVVKVTENLSGSWPDWEFHAANGDILSMPKKAAERQLERLKVAGATDLVGATIKMSRSDKPGANAKLFWNLDLVSGAAASAAASKRIPPPRGASAQSAPGFGGAAHIAGLDEDGDPGPAEPWDAQPYRPDPAPAAAPALTPREARETDAAPQTAVEMKREAFLAFYVATYRRLKHELMASDEATQAATATCVIQMNQKGMLP